MESQFIMCCHYYCTKSFSFQRRMTSIDPCWAWNSQQRKAICLKAKINWDGKAHKRRLKSTWGMPNSQRLFSITKANGSTDELTKDSNTGPEKKKGTIVGAVALIIGTSIGSGILALPNKTSPAGFIPSAISMILCWGFLLIEALLLVEINVGLWKKKKRREDELDIEIVSITTMAQGTLGKWGGNLATINYIFLAYTSMVAYTAKSGDLLSHLINLPTSLSGFLFTTLFTLVISVGGTQLTDQVNQWLTAIMIGLLVLIEVVAVIFGGWSGSEATADWGKVPATIPVIIFSLVYHDLAPVICAYLGGDLPRIRTSVMIGSLVPLIALLVWDAVALGLAQDADGVDPVELLMRVRWSGVSSMVEAFSLLAVGTSMIGTILGFSKFFVEQLEFFLPKSLSPNKLEQGNSERRSRASFQGGGSRASYLREWWESKKPNFNAVAMAMVVAPPILISTIVPDAFSAATDVAGGYCMIVLYGVLPPAMAWAMHTKASEREGDEDDGRKTLVGAMPALIGVGLIACAIVLEQIQQDLSLWHH